MKAALILATQLLEGHPALEDPDIDAFLVVESAARFERLPYHQHKIVLLLAGLRSMVARLRADGRVVHTVRMEEELSFAAGLERLVREHDIDGLAWMSATDRGPDQRLLRLSARLGLRTKVYEDELFVTPAALVDEWFAAHPTPVMEDFYRWQRRRLDLLMDGTKPLGGQWNFDVENRHPLPKRGVAIPGVPPVPRDPIVDEVIAEVAVRFPGHPGDAATFWLPVTPDGAREWLQSFVRDRLPLFGRYEDAMARDEAFLFHSVLSPLLNIGLLTVDEVVDAALGADSVPISSLEGFLRQIVGWREYMRGMYRAHPELEQVNALAHTRPLEDWWYTGRELPDDVPLPIRTVLARVHERGWAHHIERLMVLGNWFLLSGYAPREVNRWFLSLFVDAYDWVMVPNIMGMSQYADGGLVGTKPYVSGGAYLQRMGSWWTSQQEAKESEYTQRYWRFLEEHEQLLSDNPRLFRPLAQMRARREQAREEQPPD